jgi:hypothetical protein
LSAYRKIALVRFGEDEEAIETRPLLSALTHGNGLIHSRAYDNDNLLASLVVNDGAVARLSRGHSYGDKLSLTQITDAVSPTQGQAFWLSIAGRLQNADGPWGSDLYSHNGVGNLTNHDRTAGGVTTSRVLGDAAKGTVWQAAIRRRR